MLDIFSSPLMKRIVSALPTGVDVYLVGGAVRDALLGRSSYDLDFVLAGDTLRITRGLADKLGGAYFPLDVEREYARIVLEERQVGIKGGRIKLDFATYQSGSLDSDLHLRDFTINAMAVHVHHPEQLIDLLGGAGDLLAKRLRVCSADSLKNDPLRTLRAVRQAIDYELQIMPETIRLMRQAASWLDQVSPERQRDELFRILEGRNPRASLEILERIGALQMLLPEVVAMKGVEQAAPHIYDVWTHTLEVVKGLTMILATLSEEYDPETASSLMLGLVSLRLGRYRQALEQHLGEQLNPDRSLRALLFLAGLYHDSGKPACRQVDEQGRTRFLGHDQEGEQRIEERALALRLSNVEIERSRLIVRHHMRPFLLGQTEGQPTRKAIYRFFRDTGAAGVDICILSLADMLATYGTTLRQEDWVHHLDVVRSLLEAWWENPQEQIAPPPLVDGNALMKALQLSPGPIIGQLLEAIREGQATGTVKTKEQALELAQHITEGLNQG